MKRLVPVLMLAVALLSACAPQAAPTQEIAEQPAANALFVIVRPDGSTYGVTVDELRTLPLATVSAEGKIEEGPYLKDVLALAGVTEFSEVTLSGSSNPATLTFEQVDENTILDFNNHGTMKLASTYIAKANWTKDVAEIVVK